MTEPVSILELDRGALEALCARAGAKPVHAEALQAHVFRRGRLDLDAIPDLPRTLRHWLAHHLRTDLPPVLARRQSSDGTEKLLLGMADGKEVETVLIPAAKRLTQCISTQVGCAIGCTFCLTASAGLVRHLSTGEMVAQVMAAWRLRGERARNLVLMGMGEPLHNYEAVARFVRTATDPKGMAFSPNRITLSTAGLVPGIRRMQADALPCNLAVSLNATTDAVRDRIMPINRKYPLAELLAAIRDYIAARGGKRVLIEYVLLDGINDTPADARRLSGLLADLDITINLLPFNAHAAAPYGRPDERRVAAFRDILQQAGFVTVVRDSRGRDISAACGQLRTEIRQRRRTTEYPCPE
ncbi:MAG: 23S rRNA (adenine(2503)-C(2))-methyltransferase RlmN [Zetaproteobacteria bacterium]|nr:MAG: 23S rRNA (adenine(2503)-C(2))-methyltransferase RlmN [Zetaproteobacteria bacterium]